MIHHHFPSCKCTENSILDFIMTKPYSSDSTSSTLELQLRQNFESFAFKNQTIKAKIYICQNLRSHKSKSLKQAIKHNPKFYRRYGFASTGIKLHFGGEKQCVIM